MIEEFAKLIPGELIARSGSVFYSGRRAFERSCQMYIMGLNPGGDPVKQAQETIGWHTNKVLSDVPDDWSAYRDESWSSSIPGTHKMQPRVLHLLKRLKLDPGSVPASNMIFLRSGREDRLEDDLSHLVDICWPFHEKVIEELTPRVILCLGNTTGNRVRQRLNARNQIAEYVENNTRRWRSRAFRNVDGVTVVVVTHPSIADWTAIATDPTELVENAFDAP
jgi:hypothetical protein